MLTLYAACGSKRGIAIALDHLSLDRSTEAHRAGDFDMMAARALASEDLAEGIRAFRDRRCSTLLQPRDSNRRD